jgi:hypothetical protein
MPLDLYAIAPLTAPQPSPPARQFSFTGFQTNNPTAPPPGDKLDGEYDRTNTTLTQTLAWVQTSLNTDGTIRPGIVGTAQLVPGLWQSIADDITNDVQGSVDQAQGYATSALTSRNAASASASAAQTQSQAASGSASTAQTAAGSAQTSVTSAQTSANTASNAATTASNAASNATGAEASASNYAVLTQAWAEHMPDVIPPNILAANDITGDHWSSRWWANRAHEVVQEDAAAALCDLQQHWMGDYASPPTQTTCGDPVTAGALYYNTAEQVCQVYDGAVWHDVTQPVPGQIDEYLYLPSVPTTVLTGVDAHGNTLTLDPASSEIAVYRNGTKLIKLRDYTVTANAVTLAVPVTAPTTVEIVALNDLTRRPPPTGVKVNTSIWAFDGVVLSFPLQDSVGDVIDPPGPVDSIVSVDGVLLQPGADYTTRTGWIDFAVAPLADASRWMTVGLPFGGGTTVIPAANISVTPPVAGASDVQAALANIYALATTIDAGTY